MNYISTRAANSAVQDRKRFCEILLEGLAPDGGLYLPEAYPQVDAATLSKWRGIYATHGYAVLAFEILSLHDALPISRQQRQVRAAHARPQAHTNLFS